MTVRSSPRRLGSLALVLLILGGVTVSVAQDSSPEADAFRARYERLLSLLPEELRGADAPIPDEQNAYGPWKRALERFVGFEEHVDGLQPESQDSEEALRDLLAAVIGGDRPFPGGPEGKVLDGWLRQNASAVKDLAAVLDRPYLRFPEGTVLDPLGAVPGLQGAAILGVGDWLLLKAMREAARDDVAAALETVRFHLLMARRLRRASGPHFLLTAMVGLGLEGGAQHEVRRLLSSDRLRSEELQSLRAALESHGDLVEDLRTALARSLAKGVTLHLAAALPERLSTREFARSLSRAIPQDVRRPVRRAVVRMLGDRPVAFDAEETAKLVGRLTQTLGRDASLPPLEDAVRCLREVEEAVDPWPESIDVLRLLGSLLRAFRDDPGEERELSGVAVPDDAAVRRAREGLAELPNPVGHWLVNFEGVAYRRAILEVRSAQRTLDLSRILIAVRLHELEHGELPARLDPLVEAGLLERLPLDPLEAKPYRYSRERRLLWDSRDDEGPSTDSVELPWTSSIAPSRKGPGAR